MDKKHKAQKSMAGTTTKNARPGVKNTHEKSHVPQKSNANIDKKSHAQTAKVNHKQTLPTLIIGSVFVSISFFSYF